MFKTCIFYINQITVMSDIVMLVNDFMASILFFQWYIYFVPLLQNKQKVDTDISFAF